MSEPLQYIVDETGHKTSVLVPLKVWETAYQRLSETAK